MSTASIIAAYGETFSSTIKAFLGPVMDRIYLPDDSGRFDLRTFAWETINRRDFWKGNFIHPKIQNSYPFIYI